jgi:pimeloyl-ACP methyl ester carboxylesterase
VSAATVRVADRDVRDERRGLTLRVRVRSPEGHGPFPCVIFSHGFGGSRLGYAFLGEHLARHGIACVQPTHPGTDASVLQRHSDAKAALRALLHDPQRWRAMPLDVAAVLDAIEAGALAGPGGAALDGARVAVAGHSFGAYAAMLVAGARIFVEGRGEQHGDPRPRAFLWLSPPGLGERGLEHGSLREVTRPVLSLYGSRDVGPRDQPAEWRRAAFDELPPGGKMELVIEGAPHETFAGQPEGRTPPDPRHVDVVLRACLLFARAHLSGDAAALPGDLAGLAGTSLRVK